MSAPGKVSSGGVDISDVGPDSVSKLFKGRDFNSKASNALGVKVFAAQYIRKSLQLKPKPKEKEKA